MWVLFGVNILDFDLVGLVNVLLRKSWNLDSDALKDLALRFVFAFC